MQLMILFMVACYFPGDTVSGKILDGTHGGIGKAESLQLILLENSMTVLGTLTNVEDSFSFETTESLTGKRLLLQANKEGVLYSESIQWPSEDGIVLTVYDAVEEMPIKASIGSVALYAYAQSVDIGLFYTLTNDSEPKKTLNRAEGTFSFDLIHGQTALEASTRRGTLPLRQSLVVEGDRATLQYSLKPGDTQLMVRTRHVYNPHEVNTISLKLPEGQGAMKVLSLPASLELEADGLVYISEDTKENMSLYEWAPKEGVTELRIKVKGKPLDKPMDEAGSGSNQTADTKAAHATKVERRPHPLDEYRWAIIAGLLAIFTTFAVVGARR